jgi:DNA-binding PadR family transcriptional regulator
MRSSKASSRARGEPSAWDRAPCTRLSNLEDARLIEEAADPGVEPANGQEAQRRYYALTERGWRTLEDEIRQLGLLVDEALANPRLRKGLA